MSWTDTLDDERRDRLETALDERGATHLRYAGDDRDFALFLLVADALAARRYGLSIFDLADYRWRDAYDGDLAPSHALTEAFENDDLAAMGRVLDTPST